MAGPHQLPRPQIVRHGAHDNAAPRRPFQSLDNLSPVRVVKPDVEQEVDVFPRRVDVGDHRVYCAVRVRHQAGGIAGNRKKATDRLPQPKELLVIGPEALHGFPVLVPGLWGRADKRDRRLVTRDTAATDIRFPEQNIS